MSSNNSRKEVVNSSVQMNDKVTKGGIIKWEQI
jgi:hypothetical protein